VQGPGVSCVEDRGGRSVRPAALVSY